jgi:hypothetical protein
MAEFDTTKGAFYLVAMIIATMMLLLLMGMGTCTYLAVTGSAMPVCENLENFGKEIITLAFTAAVAFAGGRLSSPVAPRPKLPKPEKPSPKPPKPPTSVNHGNPKPPVLPDLK